MSEIKKTSRRPYLLRAMHEWISENLETPYVVVDALLPGVEVPQEHVADGKIILNLSYSAVESLQLGNEWLMFNARFSGISQSLAVPIGAVLAVYSKETGEGLIFEDEDDATPPTLPTGTDDSSASQDQPVTKEIQKPDAGKRSHLRVVK